MNFIESYECFPKCEQSPMYDTLHFDNLNSDILFCKATNKTVYDFNIIWPLELFTLSERRKIYNVWKLIIIPLSL